jgi:hypothetical protein
MILTKKLAERAKALIRTAGPFDTVGVCGAFKTIGIPTTGIKGLFPKTRRHLHSNIGYIWPCTKPGDEKRRIFIDSLIGKDL